MVNKRRIRPINSNHYLRGPVLYWMGREQRVQDNWALLAAQAIAEANAVPLVVAFTLTPTYLETGWRQYAFMFEGLREVETELNTLGIPFVLLTGEPGDVLPSLAKELKIGAIVTDFLPLHIIRQWKEDVAKAVAIPMYEVDAHNVVPAWIASPKAEYGAYTFRPKVRKLWPEFLEDFPVVNPQTTLWEKTFDPVNWQKCEAFVKASRSITAVTWAIGGTSNGLSMLEGFMNDRLDGYSTKRNLPGVEALSELSPYYHYGQVAPQRVALTVQASNAPEADKEAYLEELLVRRELSDNFCFYTKEYQRYEAAPEWAKKSLEKHVEDPREFTYSIEEFEKASTHDTLWNAAQNEMLKKGKMHGYMRMYWAKKILEWSATPQEAYQTAITLNNRYFLDGCDPSSYVGVLWAIAGLHDRPWFERPIFGQVRYMNRNGSERKFNVDRYIEYVQALP